MSNFTWGLGRRKTSVARVRIKAGEGKVIVNGQPYDVYFNSQKSCENATMPLDKLDVRKKYDVYAKVDGGGKEGQSGAVLLGIARALKKESEEYESQLRDLGLLTRDPRMKERKKPGMKGARARFQFSKR
jgi:small subunit ribosomal protein S9